MAGLGDALRAPYVLADANETTAGIPVSAGHTQDTRPKATQTGDSSRGLVAGQFIAGGRLHEIALRRFIGERYADGRPVVLLK